jgi:acyl carrier protein
MNTPNVSVEDRVRKMIHDVTAIPVDQILMEQRLREDLGMDSVRAMELVSVLDEEMGVEVELDEALAVNTVQAVVDLARRYA